MAHDCISCGMPAAEITKHGIDIGKDWCGYCAREDGSLKSYQEVEDGYTHWLVGSLGMDETEARQQAQAALSTQPAWRSR
ncbi:MAG TPA: zinc ribbon domain-containing protein [bacterium]|nr:zinc ribbon domain-containing protein [bacterium]